MSVEPNEIEVRFWPLRISAKGKQAVAVFKWPMTVVMIAIGFATAGAIFAKGIWMLP